MPHSQVSPKILHAAVGAGSHTPNRSEDVKVVQHFLNLIAHGQAVAEDGHCSPELVRRISQFQSINLHFKHPDGRVDPDGRTITGLIEKAAVAGGRRTAPKAANDHPAAAPAVQNALRHGVSSGLQKQVQANKLATPAGQTGGGLSDQDFVQAAARLGSGVEPAILHAFADVESGGKSGFGHDGLPIIAFEGHIFRKYTHKVYDHSHPLLSYPYVKKAGPQWRTNNADQKTAWKTLQEAAALDHNAALMACSWGMFQVMGFNYASCGYKTVDAFVDDMKKSARGQLDAFVGFCQKTSGMVAAMARKDYAGMASRYNGADYGDYDRRIAKAYARHGGK